MKWLVYLSDVIYRWRRTYALVFSLSLALIYSFFPVWVGAQTIGLISAWGFASNAITDDLNGCVGCANNGATWYYPSIYSGGFEFNGTRSYLNLGTVPYLHKRTSFTVSVWL